ncbi:hypothetical protein A2U01_0051975, partial [Trifolium medium]|nr:hypothetical protein [Trifolium medium]
LAMQVTEGTSKLTVIPGREAWRIKVRVVRIWDIPTF